MERTVPARLIAALVKFVAVIASVAAVTLLAAPAAHTEPVGPALIAVDADPVLGGIQTSATYASSAGFVSVDVVVQTTHDTGAWEVDVLFDSTYLQFLGWTERAFLGSTGRATSCQELVNEHDVRLGCTTSGPVPPPGAAGAGVLVTLRFRPLAGGQTCLMLLLADTADVAGDPIPTSSQDACLIFSPDTDGDGCHDSAEPALVPPLDPADPWDFYSVPAPALFAAANPGAVFHDSAVTAADAQAVFAYARQNAAAGHPYYEGDMNGNGIKDGFEYDRHPGSGAPGPPDGAVTAQDAQAVFAQAKMNYACP